MRNYSLRNNTFLSILRGELGIGEKKHAGLGFRGGGKETTGGTKETSKTGIDLFKEEQILLKARASS